MSTLSCSEILTAVPGKRNVKDDTVGAETGLTVLGSREEMSVDARSRLVG